MAARVVIVCEECQMTFASTSSLVKHKRGKHGLAQAKPRAVTKGFHCSECTESFSRYAKIMCHYKKNHKHIVINEEILQFTSVEDMKSWKENIEKTTISKFVAASGYGRKRITENDTIQYLVCHRSGVYKPEGKGLRELKSGGSNKIGFCPARMIIITRGTNITVKFNSTHVGHDCEVDRLPMSRAEKKSLARQMILGVSKETILENLYKEKVLKNIDKEKTLNKSKSEVKELLTASLQLLESCSTQAEVDAIKEIASAIEPRVLEIQAALAAESSLKLNSGNTGEFQLIKTLKNKKFCPQRRGNDQSEIEPKQQKIEIIIFQ